MYSYVWEYVVHPERVAEFEAGYGPEGDWVRLFRQDPEYLHTSLLRGRDDPGRFMTIDFWTSCQASTSFRERHAREFQALDERFEALTLKESHIGEFDVVGPDSL